MLIEKDLLTILNPWWQESTISKELAKKYKREIFDDILTLFNKKQITVITGLRRVGKSTTIFQIIEKLLNQKTKPTNILYFSFDEKIENLTEILEEYEKLTNVDWKKEKCFIFFDEIQKLDNWSNKLKIIYDHFPKLKITVSGSASFQLEKEAKVNLSGRHFTAEINPLSFAEYLALKKSKIDPNKKLLSKEIKKEIDNYLLRPFPEIVSFQELSLVKRYIKDNIVEKILKVDLSEKFKDVNEDLLTTLIDLFYDRPGIYLNLDNISKDLKIGKSTLVQHLYYLELSKLIRRVKNFRPSSKSVSRKLQRIYPFHWSLQFGWNGKIDFESVIASMIDAKYYWRKDKKEIDFLIKKDNKIIPIEVKESSSTKPEFFKNLIYFMDQFKADKSYLIYNGTTEKIIQDKKNINKICFRDLITGMIQIN